MFRFLSYRLISPTRFHTMLGLFLSLALTVSVSAHTDYEEIQVKSFFQVNQQQQISAITMVWLYDTFSSQDRLSHEEDLNKLAKVMVSDIARFNYFTRLNSGDRRLVTNKLNNYKLIKAKDIDGNIALQLTVSLLINKPISITELKNIKINHADPTGKAIFYYDNATSIVLDDALKTRCNAVVKEKATFKTGEFPQIATINCRA